MTQKMIITSFHWSLTDCPSLKIDVFLPKNLGKRGQRSTHTWETHRLSYSSRTESNRLSLHRHVSLAWASWSQLTLTKHAKQCSPALVSRISTKTSTLETIAPLQLLWRRCIRKSIAGHQVELSLDSGKQEKHISMRESNLRSKSLQLSKVQSRKPFRRTITRLQWVLLPSSILTKTASWRNL